METENYSFLKYLFGRNTYEGFKEEGGKYTHIATGILLLIFLLSLKFHWGILSYILDITFGYSLLFILYIISLVIMLDRGIPIEIKYDYNHNYVPPAEKPKGYTRTVVWGCILIAFGIVLVYATQQYKRHYGFECDTFRVDTINGTYHLSDNDCEEASLADNLVEMQGYEIEETDYEFCEECQEWLEDAEDAYVESQYRRP